MVEPEWAAISQTAQLLVRSASRWRIVLFSGKTEDDGVMMAAVAGAPNGVPLRVERQATGRSCCGAAAMFRAEHTVRRRNCRVRLD